MTTPNETNQAPGKAVVITRVFDAPADLVWKVWTDPEHIMKWWGPKGYTAPAAKVDLRIGGGYHYCMRSAEGQVFWSKGTYLEIIPGKKIVATDSFADEHGNLVPSAQMGMPGLPDEFIITVTFEEKDGKTIFTLIHENMPEGMMSDMTAAGWNQSFDKMVDVISQLK
jgi:uncharacterized protein YndB with AHSA1/START domain